MKTWTQKMGYPLINVEQSRLECDCRQLVLKQKRYLCDGGIDELGTVWQVPVSITTASDPAKETHKILLTKSEDTITLKGVKATDWLKVI